MSWLQQVAPLVVTGLLSGGLFGAVASFRTSRSLARKTEVETEQLERESSAKVDAISVQGSDAAVLTMERALLAAERRAERAEARNEELELERTEDRKTIESLRREVSELRRQLGERATGIERQLDHLARKHDERDSQQS